MMSDYVYIKLALTCIEKQPPTPNKMNENKKRHGRTDTGLIAIDDDNRDSNTYKKKFVSPQQEGRGKVQGLWAKTRIVEILN